MKEKYIGFLTVRINSTRLKKKCLLTINGKTIIEHCILRCLLNGITPIICTTNNKEDNYFEKVAMKFNIKIFRGSEKNKIKRWYDCAKKYSIKQFHTIDVDDPYFDFHSIKKSLNQLKNYDIVLPSEASRNGGASEGYSFKLSSIKYLFLSLKNFEYKNLNNLNTEMIDGFINFTSKNLKLKKFKGMAYQIKNGIRLTLDYKKDYKLFSIISKKFNFNSNRSNINKFLKKNKNILKINILLNNKWRNKQNNFIMPKIIK